MKPVTTIVEKSGKRDQLDGEDLTEGQWINLTWPDNGEVEHYEVHLDVRCTTRKKKDRLAFVVAPMRGSTNRVYLRWQPSILCERHIAPL